MLVTDISNIENPKSTMILELVCDYCNREFSRRFSNHNLISENERNIIDKDACENCQSKKVKEMRDIKQQNGLLTKDDHGYWQYKENLLKELDIYIKSKGTLNKMQHDKEYNGKALWSIINNNGYHPYYLTKELGYKLSDLTTHRPLNYYDDFNNIIEEIEYLVSKIDRFPTAIELTRIGINANIVKKFGGIYELKKLLGYKDNLIDDSGYKNSSKQEFIVAQFLLNNNVTYKREQFPFPKEGKYRSDFTFYLDNKTIYVEVWGHTLDDTSERGLLYNEARKKKTSLYKFYNLELIEIEPTVFKNTYEEIIKILKQTFSTVLDNRQNLKTVELQKSIQAIQMSDLEILSFLSGLLPEENNNVVPVSKVLQENYRKIYTEISKRHGTYSNFLKKYNYKTNRSYGKIWTKEKIFELFQYSLDKYNKILSYKEMNLTKKQDTKLIGLDGAINTHGGFVNLRLQFYIEKDIDLSKYQSEIEWVKLIASNKSVGYHELNDQQILLAKEIHSKIIK
jgi:hypothetical protein